MKPTIGRIVLYVMSENDCNAVSVAVLHGKLAGQGINLPRPGDILPLIICRVWDAALYDGRESINGQVMLDGSGSHWVTSVHPSTDETPGTWHWPKIERPLSHAQWCAEMACAQPVKGSHLQALADAEILASSLCELIEGAGASDELTACSIRASQLIAHLQQAKQS